MSKWVSQCLLISLLSASCFPQEVQENLAVVPHPVWLIILSRIVARSTHIEGQFYFEIYFSGITPLDTYNVTHHKEL